MIMDAALVVHVVRPDDVAVVQRGGGPGLAVEAGQIRRVFHAALGQHLDRHPPLHQHVFGQIDAAHPAGAQQAQQLVLAQEEALVAPFQQPIGLPAGEQTGLDDPIGHEGGVGDRVAAGLALQFQQQGVEAILFHQPAAAHEVEKCVYLRLGHACSVPRGVIRLL